MEQFKSAIVYGKSVKHQPQRVGLAHELDDEDVGKCSLNLAPFPPPFVLLLVLRGMRWSMKELYHACIFLFFHHGIGIGL